MYSLQSTNVMEWPALALGLYLLSRINILFYSSQLVDKGSKVYKSLKQ